MSKGDGIQEVKSGPSKGRSMRYFVLRWRPKAIHARGIAGRAGTALVFGLALVQPLRAQVDREARLKAIHDRHVFSDIHAHPSAFHRANVERIEPAEIARYQRGFMDLVVANVSSDAAYQGGVTNRDGTRVPRLSNNEVKPTRPSQPFAINVDRFIRI